MDKPKCATCVYYVQRKKQIRGHCHSKPPAIVRHHGRVSGYSAELSQWPLVKDTEFCGDHQDFKKWMLDRTHYTVPVLTGGTALIPKQEARTCSPELSAADTTTHSSTPSPTGS